MPSNPTPSSENPEPGKSADEKATDGFGPPAEPCECYCLHCNRVFMSDGMWFQKVNNAQDGFDGFWMCPTPNCSGAGYTFDIFPTDPHHPDNEGWVDDDDDDDEDGETLFDEEEAAAPVAEYDPTEPKYAELDEQFGDGDDEDDLEGEEWKHGLEPGERPPEPPWAAEARQRYEEEQKKFDAPDERPREIDWTDRPRPPKESGSDGEIGESDIPF